MKVFRELGDRVKEPQELRISIRQKLLVYLYIFYLWIPLRAGMKNDNRLQKSDCRTRDGRTSKKSPDEKIDSNYIDVCLPRLSRLAVVYYFISTGVHIVIILHSILIKLRSVPENQVADDFIICYMPRVHRTEMLRQNYQIWLGLAISLLHLFIRIVALVYGRKFRLDAITFLLMEEKDFNQGLLTLQLPSRMQSDAMGYFPESLLFLRVESAQTNRVSFILRPNRAYPARERLTRLINSSFILSIAGLLSPIPLVPKSIHQILFKHESIFEGCRISYFDSVYWYRAISSLFVTLLSLIDTSLVISFSLGLFGFLVFDMVLYWRAINERIVRLRRGMEISLYMNPNTAADKERNFKSSPQSLDKGNIEQDLFEVRALICDFFANLSWTNEAVSTFTLVLFVVYFVFNGMSILFGLQLKGTLSIVIRLMQLVAIIVIVAGSHAILQVQRHTSASYTSLCSIMALDSRTRKTDWIEIIEHYTDKRSHYAFTFPGLGVFDKLMFFKTLSYMISLIIFVDQYEIYVERGRH